MSGWLYCASGNDFACVEDNGDQWKVVAVIFCFINTVDPLQCGESCQAMSTPCHGSCPHGHILMENECALQESLCPEEQCAQDSDCQENAGCLLSGTVICEILL